MGFGERAIVGNRAWITDRDAVVGPTFYGCKNLRCHSLCSHGWSGENLDRNTHVRRCDFDVGTANIDDQRFHCELDVSSES